MKINLSNLKKTYYYLRKNGCRSAFFAAMERLQKQPYEDYRYEKPSGEELYRQKSHSFENAVTFSILVPAYETKPEYLKALLQSVQDQTYEKWELILADASKSDFVKTTLEQFCKDTGETRIRYFRLPENKGISANSNAALENAMGEYVALLDHDDLLTPDALYENALQINQAETEGISLSMLYSDEDKCDETGTSFYEVHKKKDFDLELLLSNNYICHLLVMKRELMQKLQFRCNFDGSQDYDLILRGVSAILPETEQIVHIPKVLYHWRCHSASTASNPASKQYAYEAGRRALEDFLHSRYWEAEAEHAKHLGFYHVLYKPDLLTVRKDVGAVGGMVLSKNGHRVVSGILDETGHCPYAGMRTEYSGYMHRADLQQEAFAVDLRCIQVREEFKPLYEALLNRPGKTEQNSLELCKAIRERGYKILWDPSIRSRID